MSRISIKSWLAATTAAVALAGGATLATASPASGAAGGATIIRTDETGEVVVCDDGVLTVTSGVFKIVVHETLTPNGGYHLGVEGNAQGVKAVAPTGATYQLPGGFWMETNVTPGATSSTSSAKGAHPISRSGASLTQPSTRTVTSPPPSTTSPQPGTAFTHSQFTRALTNIEASILRLEIFDCVRSQLNPIHVPGGRDAQKCPDGARGGWAGCGSGSCRIRARLARRQRWPADSRGLR